MKMRSLSGYTLHVRSMRKMHKVEDIAFDKAKSDKLFKTKDWISVAQIPGMESSSLLADAYGGDRSMLIEDKHCERIAYTGMYLNTVDGMYQVAKVFETEKEALAFTDRHLDTVLLDTLELEGEKHLFFVTACEVAKVL